MRMMRLFTLLLVCVLMIGTVCSIPAAAADSAYTATQSTAGYQSIAFPMTVTTSTNRWSHLMYAYQFQTSDTTFVTVNYSIKNKELVVCFDTYDMQTYKLLSTKTVPSELGGWAGAYYDGTYYYLAFSSSSNPNQDYSKEMLRVVKYDKNLKRIGAVNCGDGWATDMCHAGSLRMDSYGNTLIVYTARERYDGHQSNILYGIDTRTMTLLDYQEDGPFPGCHVSHSFNQYVRFDNNGVLYLSDHGDGYPRGISAQAHDLTESIPFHVSGQMPAMYLVPGEIGANCTGITYGGFELSNTEGNMLSVINTIDHSKVTNYTSFTMSGLGRDERDVLLLVAPKDGSYKKGEAKQVRLSQYIGKGYLASTPYLVKINDDCFMVLWEAFQYTSSNAAKSQGVRYVYVDGTGKTISGVKTLSDAHLSCTNEPKLIGSEVIWYLNSDTQPTRTFYRIDSNYGKKPQTITAEMPSSKTYGDAPFKISVTADSTSKLSTFRYYSDNPAVATVSANGTVTIVGAGSANITVKQNGNNSYKETSVTKRLAVGKKRIDIYADNAIKQVGTEDPVFTFTYTGEIIDDAVFTGALSRLQGEAVGTYALRRGSLSLGDNYYLSVKSGELSIVDDLAVPTIKTEALPVGCVGEQYRAELVTDANYPIEWSLISGTLPAGLTFENGVLSGTPTTESKASLTFRAKGVDGAHVLPVEKTLELAVHTFSEMNAITTDNPTCTKPGTRVYECEVCSYWHYAEIPPKGTAGSPSPDCSSAKFTDVKYGDWFHDAVDYMASGGIMNGTSDSTFAPSMKISRAMIVQILYNREYRPEQTNTSSYSDVTPDKWYYDAMRWAEANDLVFDEDSDGIIGADSEITREEIALILWRYFGKPQSSRSLDTFVDCASISADAYPAFRWAVEFEVYRGNDAACLNPKNTAMRSEAAQIFSNLFYRFGY